MEKRGGGFVGEKHLKSSHIHLGKIFDEFSKKYGVDQLCFRSFRFFGSATPPMGVFDSGQVHGYFFVNNFLIHSKGGVQFGAV